MNIIKLELKKIWNLRTIGITLFFCAFFFLGYGMPETLRQLRHSTEIELTPEQARDLLEIQPRDLRLMLSYKLLEWRRWFYTTGMESEDLQAFVTETRADLTAQAEAAGYDDRTLHDEESGFLGQRIATLRATQWNLDDFGEARTRAFLASNLIRDNRQEPTDRQRLRLTEILETGEYNSPLHNDIFWRFTDLLWRVAFILMVVSLVQHAPLLTTDRVRGLLPLQYSSRVGRRVKLRQFYAVLLSSFLFTTMVLAAVGVFLHSAGVLAYWNEGITSYRNHAGPFAIAVAFWPMSFGTYILIMAGACYVLSLGAAAVGFVLSFAARSMIKLAVLIVPTFAALSYFHSRILPNRWSIRWVVDYFSAPLTLWNELYLRTGIPYLDMMLMGVYALLMTTTALLLARWEKGRELL